MLVARFTDDSFHSKKYRESTDRERSCTEKNKYKTQTEAAEAARTYNLEIVIKGSEVHAYPCRHCCYWHFGHDNRERHKGKRATFLKEYSAILLLLNPDFSRVGDSKQIRFPQASTQEQFSRVA